MDPGRRPGPGDGRPGHRRPDGDLPPEEERPERQTERKDSEVILGENGYPEGFDRELLGARPGETRTFSLTWVLLLAGDRRGGGRAGAGAEAEAGG